MSRKVGVSCSGPLGARKRKNKRRKVPLILSGLKGLFFRVHAGWQGHQSSDQKIWLRDWVTWLPNHHPRSSPGELDFSLFSLINPQIVGLVNLSGGFYSDEMEESGLNWNATGCITNGTWFLSLLWICIGGGSSVWSSSPSSTSYMKSAISVEVEGHIETPVDWIAWSSTS